MSVGGKAINVYMAYQFVRILTTPWDKTEAYELGLIDNKGVVLRQPQSQTEKASMTVFHRLIFNIKRLFARFGLTGRLSSFAAAAFLLREHVMETSPEAWPDIEAELMKAIGDKGIDITETTTQDIIYEGCYLVAGYAGSGVRVTEVLNIDEGLQPFDKSLGVPVYRASSINHRNIVFTLDDIISEEC
jgi:hypothetical protein